MVNNNPDYDTWGEFACFQGNDSSCCCPGWGEPFGSDLQNAFQNWLSWAVFAISCAILVFYGYQTYRRVCGWEEVYVCIIEAIKMFIDGTWELNIPSTLFLANGTRFVWSRYAEWLLTCPVILIHMSDLTGMGETYNKKTMMLLVSDIGCVVFGATSAMVDVPWLKAFFFFIGLAYGLFTYFLAATVYIEAFHTVPRGICRTLIYWMAWIYFIGWTVYPLMFVLGPEWTNIASYFSVTIVTTFSDLFAKNLWGLLGHFLRIKLREHIVTHGSLRKKKKIRLSSSIEIEVEQFVDPEEKGVEPADQDEANAKKRPRSADMQIQLGSNVTSTNGSFKKVQEGYEPPAKNTVVPLCLTNGSAPSSIGLAGDAGNRSKSRSFKSRNSANSAVPDVTSIPQGGWV